MVATEHLIRQGHTQIAYISSTHHIEDTSQRLAGYKAALAAYNRVCLKAMSNMASQKAKGRASDDASINQVDRFYSSGHL